MQLGQYYVPSVGVPAESLVYDQVSPQTFAADMLPDGNEDKLEADTLEAFLVVKV